MFFCVKLLQNESKLVFLRFYLGSHARIKGILILRRAHLLPPHHLLQSHVIVIFKVAHPLPFNMSLNLQTKERRMNLCVSRIRDSRLRIWKRAQSMQEIFKRGQWWNPCGGQQNYWPWISSYFSFTRHVSNTCCLFLLPLWGSWVSEGAATGQARPAWSVLNSRTSCSCLERPLS